MKKLFKNNQVIITSLAILIVVAGYLNYAKKLGEENDYSATSSNDVIQGTNDMLDLLDISEEDILSENQVAVNSGDNLVLQGSEEIDSLDVDLEAQGTGSDMPGEAVLTSGNLGINTITEVKLKREQAKSLHKTSLMEIINSDTVTEIQKQDAIDELLAFNDIAERESEAELLLEAKGFRDVVVSISGGMVDVVVNASTLTDVDRAQIEDIVKRKTEISADKIIITPFIANN